jgi:hypothetical protein
MGRPKGPRKFLWQIYVYEEHVAWADRHALAYFRGNRSAFMRKLMTRAMEVDMLGKPYRHPWEWDPAVVDDIYLEDDQEEEDHTEFEDYEDHDDPDPWDEIKAAFGTGRGHDATPEG